MLYKHKNPHGGDIYGGDDIRLDFSANTNPKGTPREVIRQAALSLEHADWYPDPYARELVAAIAAYHGVPADYILIGAGAAEMIYSYASTSRFASALMAAPTFSEYEIALRRTGTKVLHWNMKEETGFTLTRDIFTTIEVNRPNAVFICNPNNPTGKLVDPELMKELVEFTKERNIKLFVDECFMELAGARPGVSGEVDECAPSCAVSLIPELENDPHLIILRAFTKNYGMAGLRLGYVLTADSDLLYRMAKGVQPWNLSTPAQAAGVQALKETEFLKESVKFIRTEKTYLAEELTKLGLKVIDSDVNFLLFKGPEDLAESMRKEGILIRDCSNYMGLEPGWFRVAVKLHHENEELLETMKKVLGKE